jgi:hypothetical protein
MQPIADQDRRFCPVDDEPANCCQPGAPERRNVIRRYDLSVWAKFVIGSVVPGCEHEPLARGLLLGLTLVALMTVVIIT